MEKNINYVDKVEIIAYDGQTAIPKNSLKYMPEHHHHINSNGLPEASCNFRSILTF